MKVTKQEITKENVFEQMALITKSNLLEKGILPEVANQIAIDFVKAKGLNVIKNVATKCK